MTEESAGLLDKAARAIRAAESLRRDGNLDFAAGRAYYAMLYVARALLGEAGVRPRKHGGVHTAFGEQFVKSGKLDAKYHRMLLDAYDRRLEGDYGISTAITEDDVDGMVRQAKEYLEMGRQNLGS